MKKRFLFFAIASLCVAGCKKDLSEKAADAVASGKATSAGTSANGDEFTIVIIPDTQYYMDADSHGGNVSMFNSQMDWIVDHKTTHNIAYVAGVGDIVDDPTITSDWDQAKAGYQKLLDANIPFGLTVGNHDQLGFGNPIGSTTNEYNARFGRTVFHNKPWYGGNQASYSSNNNDAHYDLFSAGGIDFVAIHVEYDDGGDSNGANLQATAMNGWVDGVLATFASRKAIIITHSLVESGSPYNFSTQGQLLYNAIKDRPNVFLMYGGHFYGRRSRVDTYNGNTIRSFLCDYQAEPLGGNGFMRILRFKPLTNTIEATSYSPHTGAYYTTSNEQFSHPMFTNPYQYPVEIVASEDASVRNGTFANSIIGGAQTLIYQRNSTTAGSTYKSYIKFDLGSNPSPVRAKLKIYGNASVTGTNATNLSCFQTTDGWDENTITWNNGPAAIGSQMGGPYIPWANSLQKYREWDITAYVQAQKAADNIVSVQITGYHDLLSSMYSSEAGTNKPTLVLYY